MKCYKVLKDLPVSVEFKIGYIYGEPAFMYLDLEKLIKDGYIEEVKEEKWKTYLGGILLKLLQKPRVNVDDTIVEIIAWHNKEMVKVLQGILDSSNFATYIINKISELEKEIK